MDDLSFLKEPNHPNLELDSHQLTMYSHREVIL